MEAVACVFSYFLSLRKYSVVKLTIFILFANILRDFNNSTRLY